MFGWLFRSRSAPDVAKLFHDIANAARNPVAYREHGVADTFEGRFERLALVTTLVLRRLSALPAPAEVVGQGVVDQLFAHLDDGFRRAGVGDLSVGKKVKALAQGFYGRAKAYTEALDSGEEAQLRAVLARNLYGSEKTAEDVPAGLLAEIEGLIAALEKKDLAGLLAGRVLAGGEA
ncbi:MAG: ubiquinol-cytochrome C chaperone [Beijerinckiaceae bacterium]|nr:ubiquinol-cytochrome C chaperone [Beijerinckiaceae bacterium]